VTAVCRLVTDLPTASSSVTMRAPSAAVRTDTTTRFVLPCVCVAARNLLSPYPLPPYRFHCSPLLSLTAAHMPGRLITPRHRSVTFVIVRFLPTAYAATIRAVGYLLPRDAYLLLRVLLPPLFFRGRCRGWRSMGSCAVALVEFQRCRTDARLPTVNPSVTCLQPPHPTCLATLTYWLYDYRTPAGCLFARTATRGVG